MNFVIDVVFVVAAVSFIKEHFGIKGYGAVAIAFGLSLVLAFVPELISAFPASQAVIEKVIMIVQIFLTAPGLFDLARELKK